MLAELMAPKMIKRGTKGTKFHYFEPEMPDGLDGIGWYVHMPFCRRLCPYCSFRSIMHSPDKVAPYIEALKQEISIYRERLGKIKTGDIYFGGGTPSLTYESVIEVAGHIRDLFAVEGEIGLEASPEDMDSRLCDSLLAAGIDRISIGVQSFDNSLLGTMRRNYRDTDVLKAIELLLSRGFDVSIDLLYGLPGQRIPGLVKDMETAAATGVHQISAYPLMPFPHTGWYKDIKSGKIPVPSAGTEKKMFYAVSDSLTSSGYRQASCWDFVSAGGNGKQYVTCTRDENIGVGLSAYTKIGGLFYVNTFHLKDYIGSVAERLPVATGMIMPAERVMRRWFMMGLYGLRIEKAEFERRFGMKPGKGIGSLLPMLKLMNIIKEQPEYIEVTRNGMYWASLMTKTSMLTFPGRYYEECLRSPWPDEFEM